MKELIKYYRELILKVENWLKIAIIIDIEKIFWRNNWEIIMIYEKAVKSTWKHDYWSKPDPFIESDKWGWN